VIPWIEFLVGCRDHQSTTVRTWLEGFRRLALDQAMASEAVICRPQRGLKGPDAQGARRLWRCAVLRSGVLPE
jgi:hypothetical protein